MEIKLIEIEKLIPYEKNAKKHPKKQIEQIAKSIKKFGFNQPLVVDDDNVVVVGHGRLLAAQSLEYKRVPIVRLSGLSEDEIKAYRLADNKLNESDWDMELVVEELKGLDSAMIDLTGFNLDELTINFSAVNEVDRLDQTEKTTCPKCNYEW